jgi:hypothetical protein
MAKVAKVTLGKATAVKRAAKRAAKVVRTTAMATPPGPGFPTGR